MATTQNSSPVTFFSFFPFIIKNFCDFCQRTYKYITHLWVTIYVCIYVSIYLCIYAQNGIFVYTFLFFELEFSWTAHSKELPRAGVTWGYTKFRGPDVYFSRPPKAKNSIKRVFQVWASLKIDIPSCRALFADHHLCGLKISERPEVFLKWPQTEHKIPIFYFKAILKILVGVSKFFLPPGNIRLDKFFQMSYLPKL